MILLDTHILVWWVNGDTKKFSRKARQALKQHCLRDELLISSISIFEIKTLERRGRLRFRVSVSEWLSQVRQLPEYRIEAITDEIAEHAGQFGDTFPGDPADRIIAATALVRDVPLVTMDERLRATAQLKSIW
ncbi:MAG TPA: type II toxin-antitoxin system VapC family toxin [Steroidobacteraceae bacterium]|nr:type II toxin-antitoxin system VapC family toxin [Steroidobacteraceae bacterium]